MIQTRPFWSLVAHFVKGMFASGDEQESGGVSLGLGAVLAILASPGAFASLFLLDKYSTLLQWFRGQKSFNPYRASVADEYFFVVLSMTITGLVMVLRWNRLFPDRRDFANLAVLPIPIRNVFLANFTALFGLALVFAIDVNAISSFLFPAFVSASDGTAAAFFRIAVSHAATVFSASLFSFFAVFALVGLLMLVLPKRLFRPVSICVRMLLVVGLVTEFFSNLFLQLLAGHVPNRPELYMRLLPSFWFLGVYEKLAGLAKPAMAQLGRQALIALLAAIVIAVAAYSLCYRRHFLRLAESLDAVGGAQHFRTPLPEWLQKILFRSGFDRACSSFALKVLFRSERHLLFLGGYLGIGLVMVAQTILDPGHRATDAFLPSTTILAVPIMLAFFLITGLRFVFDLPASLNANWTFQAAVSGPDPPPVAIVRKLMLLTVVPWETLALTPITWYRFGWKIAVEHTAIVIAVTLLLIEAVLIRFQKIPFTCSTHPDTKQLLFRILGSVVAVLIAVPMLAGLEHWTLGESPRLIVMAALLGIGWYVLRHYKQEQFFGDQGLTFEDRPAAAFELLKLV